MAETSKNKNNKKKRISKNRKTRTKKPKVVLAQKKVVGMCVVICIVCCVFLGVSLAGQKARMQSKNGQQEKSAVASSVPQKNNSMEPSAGPVSSKNREQTKNPAAKYPQPEKSEKKIEVAAQPTRKPDSSSVQQKAAQKPETVSAPVKKSQPETKKSETKKLPVNENASSTKKNVQPRTDAASPSISDKPDRNQNLVASAKTSVTSSDVIEKQIPKRRFDIPPAENGATIAIIIDDAGRNLENTKYYASLPFPLTIAVLPGMPYSRQCAEAVVKFGQELILHQPMQAANLSIDPGPGAIRADMSTYEIAQVVKQNLMELGPGVKGLNNHEGSLITANEIKIGAVLDVCSEMNVYFLDSRTTAATKAPQAALERDMKIYQKAGPYIDNEISREKMLERMYETLAFANRHGSAIVIGHVDKSVNILPQLLSEMYPYMKAAGYRFATPSQLGK